MKRVLLIAEMNEITRSLNEALLPYFQVQLCVADMDYAGKMLKIFEPDILLVLFNQIDSTGIREIKNILKEYDMLQAVLVGSQYEFRGYGFDSDNIHIHCLTRPVKNQEIIRVLCESMGLSYTDYEDKILEKKDRRKHILFVDDNPLLLRSMKALVSDKYRVSIAVSGSQAFEVMQQDCPDLIFLDCEMPIINGKMVLKAIRANYQFAHLPVIFLSAVADRDYIQELLALKPDGYILKPARQENILAMIEKHLGI